jgi:L-alanine-DL-glutamate epimerase-like enolase superfamily enzyme
MHDAIRHFSHMDLIVARVETDDGLIGNGFTYTIIPHGASEICSVIDNSFHELLADMDPRDHERVWNKMWRSVDWVGRGGIAVLAVAAVDIAIWDLKAKLAGMPLHRLLGGARDRIPVYNTDGGWLNHTVDQLVEETRKIIAAGFRGTKIKVGKDDPAEDVERVAAVREVLGPHRNLMVDANERFTAAEATKRARMWEPYNLFWFEEPLPAEDMMGHATVRAHTSIPIAIGESLFTRFQFRDYVVNGGASILQADVCRCGGITEWLKIAHMADCHNMQISPHFVMELHLPLVAAIPNGLFVEYIPSLDPILTEPLKLEDGYFHVGDAPGLGINFDWQKLKKYEVML